MGSPTLPDPTFDQTSATTLPELSRRKSTKKPVAGKKKMKSLVGKKLSKRRPK